MGGRGGAVLSGCYESAYACDCEDVQYRLRILSNGTKQYGKHCQRCGKWSAVKKTVVPFDADVKEFDPSIRERFHERARKIFEERREALESERREQQQKWWDDYSDYLLSAAWQSKRRRVLDRDCHICQACRRKKATEVHHLSYKHVFNEPLFELISVCHECHEKITEMDRNG
jgi:hypothetical protein